MPHFSSCPLGVPSEVTAPDNTNQHVAAVTDQPASHQAQVLNLVSAQPLHEAASGVQSVQQAASTGEAALQQSTSLPTQADDTQADSQADPQAHPSAGPQAYPQAGPQANQQNFPGLSQRAANQNHQQQHDSTQLLQQPLCKEQQTQQHGNTSDVPQTVTEAPLARPVPAGFVRRQARESADGTCQSVKPVAVLTSAVTGAGLKELLLQVERKVRCINATACTQEQMCSAVMWTWLGLYHKLYIALNHNPQP